MENEQAQPTVPQQIQAEQMEQQPSDITICMICREKNLTDQVVFNNCKRCNEVYCLHYASTIDPAYCTNCLHDVRVTEEVVTKTQTHYNEASDKLYTRTRKAKKISLGGMHWLFQARKISMLTDLELELAIEYHRDILNQMLYERDERRIQHFQRNRGKALPVKFSGSVTENTTETIIAKKTRTKTATKLDPVAQLAAAMQVLMQAGMTPEMIAKMAKGGK